MVTKKTAKKTIKKSVKKPVTQANEYLAKTKLEAKERASKLWG